MDRGACWDAVHGVAKSQARLSDFTFHFSFSCIGEGNGNPLQCSCLENHRDGWAAVSGVAQSLKRLSSSSSSPSPGDLHNPGIEPRSPALLADSLPSEPPGKPKNTGVGSLSLLQRVFLTQKLNRGHLHCSWILYQLSHQESP